MHAIGECISGVGLYGEGTLDNNGHRESNVITLLYLLDPSR